MVRHSNWNDSCVGCGRGNGYVTHAYKHIAVVWMYEEKGIQIIIIFVS